VVIPDYLISSIVTGVVTGVVSYAFSYLTLRDRIVKLETKLEDLLEHRELFKLETKTQDTDYDKGYFTAWYQYISFLIRFVTFQPKGYHKKIVK